MKDVPLDRIHGPRRETGLPHAHVRIEPELEPWLMPTASHGWKDQYAKSKLYPDVGIRKELLRDV